MPIETSLLMVSLVLLLSVFESKVSGCVGVPAMLLAGAIAPG